MGYVVNEVAIELIFRVFWFISGKETLYPIYKRSGWSQGRSGRLRKISPHTNLLRQLSSLYWVSIPNQLSWSTQKWHLSLLAQIYESVIKWRKRNQQIHWNCLSFLKIIYLCIYHTNMFRLFFSHDQEACYMVQQKNNVHIFQDTVIDIRVFQFQFTVC